MTSEKRLREIVAAESTLHLPAIEYLCDKYPDLTGADWDRVYDLLRTWPVLDLPVGDRDGTWWPLHGLVYAHVQRRGDRIIISRGDKPMHLTKGEALELASLLTAAAMEEA